LAPWDIILRIGGLRAQIIKKWYFSPHIYTILVPYPLGNYGHELGYNIGHHLAKMGDFPTPLATKACIYKGPKPSRLIPGPRATLLPSGLPTTWWSYPSWRGLPAPTPRPFGYPLRGVLRLSYSPGRSGASPASFSRPCVPLFHCVPLKLPKI
jgi:hypothetical protein